MSRMAKLTVTATATTESSIQSPKATYAAPSPHAGTHTATHISMRVAKPMGTVPRNRLLLGSWIMTVQISGQMVYLKKDIPNASEKSAVFKTKKTMPRMRSHSAFHGIVTKMLATIPVPIVIANHDGEKFRTMRRHPSSFFEGAEGFWVRGFEWFELTLCESLAVSALLLGGVRFRSRSTAGILTAGLFMLAS